MILTRGDLPLNIFHLMTCPWLFPTDRCLRLLDCFLHMCGKYQVVFSQQKTMTFVDSMQFNSVQKNFNHPTRGSFVLFMAGLYKNTKNKQTNKQTNKNKTKNLHKVQITIQQTQHHQQKSLTLTIV